MTINKSSDFARALNNGPYAWPGGYPVYFITSDCAVLSFQSAKENAKLICDSIREHSTDGWRVIACEVNWEDTTLVCCHSGKPIESAYGEEVTV